MFGLGMQELVLLVIIGSVCIGSAAITGGALLACKKARLIARHALSPELFGILGRDDR